MLTSLQIAALIVLLQAFNVDPAEIANIQAILTPPIVQVAQPTAAQAPALGQTNPTPPPVIPTPQVTQQQAAPAPVLPLVNVEPFIVRKVEISPGNYLRIYANHAFEVTVDNGTLGPVLVDNEMDSLPGEHNYDYKLTDYQRPLTVTLTDADNQVVTRTVQ